MDRYRPAPPAEGAVPRHRSFGWLIPSLLLVIVAAGWCAFWFYAAGRAEETIAGWTAREARSGRVYSCGDQGFGGFPFRIEFRCAGAKAELPQAQPPLTLTAPDILAAVQVYQPTLVLAEISGPVTIADPGQPPKMTANWSLAQVSLRGTPQAPQRISIVLDKPVLDRSEAGATERVFASGKTELHGRLASGSVNDKPVIDIAAKFVGATAPGLHPLATQPVDIDADTRIVGLNNFAPKSWTERFREIQQSGGRIEVRNARVRQGELVAVANGSLRLTAAGYLDGELAVTATGVEKIMSALGIDTLARSNSRSDRLGAALSLIDKMAPGAIAGAVSLLGEPAELEGRRASKMPLRFKDGVAMLGPFKLGQTAPLF